MDDQFIEAISLNDAKLVVSCLERDPGLLGCIWDNDFTPLLLACAKGHTTIVAGLLGRGASIAARTKTGNTALHLSAKLGNVSPAPEFCTHAIIRIIPHSCCRTRA